jgi:hypothetical protein
VGFSDTEITELFQRTQFFDQMVVEEDWPVVVRERVDAWRTRSFSSKMLVRLRSKAGRIIPVMVNFYRRWGKSRMHQFYACVVVMPRALSGSSSPRGTQLFHGFDAPMTAAETTGVMDTATDTAIKPEDGVPKLIDSAYTNRLSNLRSISTPSSSEQSSSALGKVMECPQLPIL